MSGPSSSNDRSGTTPSAVPRAVLLAITLTTTFSILAPLTGAAAQDLQIPEAVYPKLPAAAASATGFVPPGWTLETQVAGDLNRDGIGDLVLVLRENNPKNVVKHDILGENPFDTNPRILAVAFAIDGGARYALKLENHRLIPRRDSPTVDDPLEQGGVAIERGTLKVKLGFFASAGSWTTSSTTYRFRFDDGRLVMIGFDRDTTHRGSGETTGISINYLTGKAKLAKGSIANDAVKVQWKTLPRRALLTIDEIGDGLEFEPEQPARR